MSHHVLQRVVVRLLFDPEFVERVYADPDRALAGLDLSADERRFVVAPDRRAYGSDATRRHRALTELVREFPAASVVALHGGRGGRGGQGGHGGRGGNRGGGPPGDGIAILERFFASPIFHAVIQERGSLAAGYAAFLEHGIAIGAIRDPRAGALARLEGVVARIRRAPTRRSEAVPAGALESAAALPLRFVLTDQAALVTVPAGTFDLLAAITAAMAAEGSRDPVAQVLVPGGGLLRVLAGRDRGTRSRAARVPGDAIEHLLVEAPPALDPNADAKTDSTGDARVSPVTAELAGLLRAAAPPGAEIETLMATAHALGAEAGEEEAVILDLARQGLLVPC